MIGHIIKDFEDQYILQIMNQKFNINLEFFDNERLDLTNKKINNEIFNFLSKDVFNKIKYLNLENNEISVEGLIKCKFEKLEVLNLSQNNLSDIMMLKYSNFKELKKINLIFNSIN